MNNEFDGLQFLDIKKQVSQYCSFSLGSQMVIESEPSFNKMAVCLNNERLHEALAMVISYGPMPFSGVYDCDSAIDLASKNGTLNPEELFKIASLQIGIDGCRKYVASCNVPKERIIDLIESFNDTTHSSNEIFRCISSSYQVYDNASAKLASLRKELKTQSNLIATKMANYIQKNSQYLQEGIIAERNGRSVVLVKNMYKNTVEGLQYGASGSKAAVYVEPKEMVELNNRLTEIIYEEENEVLRILYSLSQLVKNDAPSYHANLYTLGLLDCLFAKAAWTKAKNGVAGEISDNYDLVLEKARHPLIDPKKVVANSYHLINPIKTILITGPNTGGKTVSLKIIGLFTIMFLAGFGLPCEKAEVPIYDHVFYDIGDSQSIQEDLSTFSGHITSLSKIIKSASNRSLVILDELGSGTDPLEGEALASAIIDYFRKKEIYCVASTHYSKLKSYANNYDEVMVSSVEFDQINLKPTFKYIENKIGQSNGISIASRCGIKDEIIQQAKVFKENNQSQIDAGLEKLAEQFEMVIQQEKQLEQMHLELIEKQDAFEIEKNNFEKNKQRIYDEAIQQANEIIYIAKDKSEEIIEELKTLKNYQIDTVASLNHKLDELIVEDEQEKIEENFNVGDYVLISLTNQRGDIVELNKNNATILCDGCKVKSSIANLAHVNRTKIKNRTVSRVFKAEEYRSEINLIGLRVDEALQKLAPFINTAIMSKAPYVRIIHGVGTGALRKAIWEYLKKYSAIEKVEYADLSNGGAGASIVLFKGSKK